MKAQILAGVAAAALLCGIVRPGRMTIRRPGSDGWPMSPARCRCAPTRPSLGRGRPQPTGDLRHVALDRAAGPGGLEIGPAELHLGDQAELDISGSTTAPSPPSWARGGQHRHRRPAGGRDWTVDTPRGTVTLDRPGEHRIHAGNHRGSDPGGGVLRRGADRRGPDGPVDIQGGETGAASGSHLTGYTLAQPADDSPLHDWADGRIRASLRRAALRLRAMTGYQDLDAAGTWHETPTYGTVWYPTDVPADWVPYRYGRWDHDDRWGWTWVDDQPWGFAPFHYGRWARVDDRWGWVPGPVEAHPVYAPALVSFFAGAAVGAAITAAADSHPIGWYPLGPGEPYRPPYRVSDTYVRNVNVTNIRNVEINRINNTVTNIHNGPTRSSRTAPTAASPRWCRRRSWPAASRWRMPRCRWRRTSWTMPG